MHFGCISPQPPQIIYGVGGLITGLVGSEATGAEAITLLIVLVIIAILSLAINRRALIAASLITFIVTLSQIFYESGVDGLTTFITVSMIIGGGVVFIGGRVENGAEYRLEVLPDERYLGPPLPAGDRMSELTPKEIVAELDRHIVGQSDAKRAVAIALRNRWRRKQAAPELRDEITPKNILMIGPTGVGKTEVSRRLAKLANAPFLKVEATKFTEVGYVGRDVEQIVRDLVEAAISMIRQEKRRAVEDQAKDAAEERLLDAIAGETSQSSTREVFRRKLRAGELDDKPIDIDLADHGNAMQMMDIPGAGGSMGMINLGDHVGQGDGAAHETCADECI